MRDRANWYQRWNSSKANFMALSKHWIGKKNIGRHLRTGSQPDKGEFVSVHIKSSKVCFP